MGQDSENIIRKTQVDAHPFVKDGDQDRTLPIVDEYDILQGQDLIARGWIALGGGHGTVHLARHRKTGLEYVMKVYPREVNLDFLRSRLELLKNIGHPQIVKLLDIGFTADSRPFALMERIRGETLDCFLQSLLTSPQYRDADLFPRLMRLMIRICNVVAHAHSFGAIHKDLKPQNILINTNDVHTIDSHSDTPYLIDFDLAATATTEHSWRSEGTRNWRSPGQAAGEQATTATDVYTIGMLIYFVFTGGRFPFARPETEGNHRGKPIHPIDRIAVKELIDDELGLTPPLEPFPDALWRVILRVIHPSPEEPKIESAKLLAAELLSLHKGQNHSNGPPSGLWKDLESILQSDPKREELDALRVWERRTRGGNILNTRETLFSNRTILFWAIEIGDTSPNAPPIHKNQKRAKCYALVRRLIDTAPSLINIQDDYGWTPLHLAANLGLVDVVKLLLDRGANPSQEASLLIDPAVDGGRISRLSAVAETVHNGTACSERIGGGATPLYEAAFCPHEKDAQRIIDLLVIAASQQSDRLPNIVNRSTKDGFTPLMAAIWRRNDQTAEYLATKYSADADSVERHGLNAYFLAVHAYCLAVQTGDRSLLEMARADYKHLPTVESQLKTGPLTAISITLMSGNAPKASEDIANAIKTNWNQQLSEKLPPFDRTLLHQAAERGYYDIVKQLCEKAEVSPLVRNNHGRTPKDLTPTSFANVRKYLGDREYSSRFEIPLTANAKTAKKHHE